MMSPAEVLIGVVALGELAVKLRAAVEAGAPAELIEALSAEAGALAERVRAGAERLAPGVERARAYVYATASRGVVAPYDLRELRALSLARFIEAPAAVRGVSGAYLYAPGEGYPGAEEVGDE
jgi:hypothetical protein